MAKLKKKNRAEVAAPAQPGQAEPAQAARSNSLFSFRKKSTPQAVPPRLNAGSETFGLDADGGAGTGTHALQLDNTPTLPAVRTKSMGDLDKPLPLIEPIQRMPRRQIDLAFHSAPSNAYLDCPGAAHLAAAPMEVWSEIAQHLDPTDVANLALTCKLLRLRLGLAPWLALRAEDNRLFRTAFLLPMDKQHPEHLFCFLCTSYHFRLTPGEEALYPMYKQYPVYNCPNPRDLLLPKTRVAHNRTLPFYLVQLAMRAQRHGNDYGIHLTALSRSWSCRDSDWTHRTRYHVHKGHLLMRVNSTCFAKPDMTPSEMRLFLFSRNDYTPYFSVCSHWGDGDLIKLTKCALTHVPQAAQSFTQQLRDRPRIPSQQLRKPSLMATQCEDCKPLRRCPQCPSEYLMEIKILEDKKDPIQRFKHGISVTRWTDLGDGVSPSSPEWAACNGQASYNSFAAVGNATLCSLFEAAVSSGGPTQRAMSLSHNKWSVDDVY